MPLGQSRTSTRRKRRLALATTVALLAVVIGGAEGTAPAETAQTKPNVVLVMTDDQTVEQMRALERVRRLLGRAGTTFTQSFSTFPLCCPSRATYLTGQYSHNHGVRGNNPPKGGFYRLDSSNTLPVWLRDAGYATAHIGKYLNRYGERDPRQVPAGWGEWYGSVDPTTYGFFDYCLNENGRLVAYGRDSELARACPRARRRGRAYQADVYSRKAVDYINRRAPSNRPFFLSVGYLAPHDGGQNDGPRRCRGSAKPAPRHRGRFADARLPRPSGFNERDVSDKPESIRRLSRLNSGQVAKIRTAYQCRRESLLAVDEGVGAMVDALRRKGALANTVFIFTSDNGFFQGEHRVNRGKVRAYEPSVRVPILMRGPGVPRDKRVSELTANVDLAATIVDAADATPGKRPDGVSLLDLARRPSRFSGRNILLENPLGHGRIPSYAGIRTPRYKYVEYGNGERELYDLRSDGFEERSKHDSPRYADTRRRLAGELSRLRDCSGEACRR